MNKKILLIIGIIFILNIPVYAQETQELIGQVAQIYTGSDSSSNGLIGGFSLWGLMGGILFGAIGFIAFTYGKKSSEFRPLFIGIALMILSLFFTWNNHFIFSGNSLNGSFVFFSRII